MKNIISFIIVVCSTFVGFSQNSKPVFSDNELIEFKISYMTFNTSTATLETKRETLNGKPVYHIVGNGRSSSFLSLFFKIRDRYETYIDAETYIPYRFVRNINEGGYRKNKVINFDQENNKATVHDKKHGTKKTFDVVPDVHDMMSSFYFLRNIIDETNLKKGDEESLTMFFDDENYKFKLRFLGKETIRTKYGKKECLKFRPIVVADRVFKEEESLTVWVSNDDNKIPVRISADLAVGSLTANLSHYSGLKHPF